MNPFAGKCIKINDDLYSVETWPTEPVDGAWQVWCLAGTGRTRLCLSDSDLQMIRIKLDRWAKPE
jgi:hypothetical protein